MTDETPLEKAVYVAIFTAQRLANEASYASWQSALKPQALEVSDAVLRLNEITKPFQRNLRKQDAMATGSIPFLTELEVLLGMRRELEAELGLLSELGHGFSGPDGARSSIERLNQVSDQLDGCNADITQEFDRLDILAVKLERHFRLFELHNSSSRRLIEAHRDFFRERTAEAAQAYISAAERAVELEHDWWMRRAEVYKTARTCLNSLDELQATVLQHDLVGIEVQR